MTCKQHLIRHGGHPWDGLERPNFDLLEFETTNESEAKAFVEAAQAKFWKPWLTGASDDGVHYGGFLYKPSGINQAWDDSPSNPHPGGHPAPKPQKSPSPGF